MHHTNITELSHLLLSETLIAIIRHIRLFEFCCLNEMIPDGLYGHQSYTDVIWSYNDGAWPSRLIRIINPLLSIFFQQHSTTCNALACGGSSSDPIMGSIDSTLRSIKGKLWEDVTMTTPMPIPTPPMMWSLELKTSSMASGQLWGGGDMQLVFIQLNNFKCH